MKKKRIFQLTFSILFSTLLVASLVYAWTAPSQNPPSDNVKAPINVSDAAQSKLGDFGLGGGVGQPLYWLKNIGGTLYFSSTNPAGDRVVIGQDGKVGIGVSGPAEKLEVSGAIKIGTTSNTNAGTIRWTGTDFEGYTGSNWVSLTSGGGGLWTDQGTYIYPNNYNQFVITDTGSVGIGTTEPKDRFHIGGTKGATFHDGGNKALSWNAYYNAGWKYIGDDFATQIYTDYSGDKLYIKTAPSGTAGSAISWNNGIIIDSNGNVGIGTNNPSAKLHISGSGSQLVLDGGHALHDDTNDVDEIIHAAGPTSDYRVTIQDGYGRVHHYWNADQDHKYIVSNEGAAWLFLGDTGGDGVGIKTAGKGTAGESISWNLGFYQDSNGNVGIGTTSPVQKLDVAGNVRLSGTHLIYNSAHGVIDWGSAGTGNLYFRTLSTQGDPSAYTDRVTILNNGNVGIGTTSPSQKLHVNGNIRVDGRHLYLGSAQDIYGDNSSAIYYDSNHDTVTQMIFRDKQNTQYGRVYGSGNGTYFGLLDGDGNWSYLAAKDNYTQFRINDSAKMTIKSNGNVGIGTTNPQAKLDVEGGIDADGQKVCACVYHYIPVDDWFNFSLFTPSSWTAWNCDQACLWASGYPTDTDDIYTRVLCVWDHNAEVGKMSEGLYKHRWKSGGTWHTETWAKHPNPNCGW